MLARRLRRRPNIESTLVQCLVFSGLFYPGGFLTRYPVSISFSGELGRDRWCWMDGTSKLSSDPVSPDISRGLILLVLQSQRR